jgi:radical SAM superfamily enzyme YgiQ (UPF0313 family)
LIRPDLETAGRRSRFFTWEPFRREETTLFDLQTGGSIPWALLYPSSYEVGMSNLGLHYIFFGLKQNGMGVERVFLSPSSLSVDGERRLRDFAVITASVAYEVDVLALTRILGREKIPLSWDERAKTDGPIIGIGGALTYINPLIFSGLADFVVLGDGETALRAVVKAVREAMPYSRRDKLWADLSDHPSIYVPAVHNTLIDNGGGLGKVRGHCPSLGDLLGHSLWLTPHAAFGETLLVELQRGCARRCPYCTIPACFGSDRKQPVEIVKEKIEALQHRFSFDRVGLVTPEASDYPYLDDLLDFLEGLNCSVSFASLRLDALTSKMVRALVAGGRRGLTVAPECGSDALRYSLGKPFSNDTIIETLSMAADEGVRSVKLYFMVGLPGERDEDVAQIADLARSIRDSARLKVVLAVNLFVPKPHTPWSGAAFLGQREGKRRLALLKKALRGDSKGIEVREGGVREAAVEYRLTWATLQDGVCLATKGRFCDCFPNARETTMELSSLGLS